MCVLLGSAQKAPSATPRFFLHETKMQSSKLSFSTHSNATARRCYSQREPLGGLYVCVVAGQAGKGTHISSKRLDTPCCLQSPPRLRCQGLISLAKTKTHRHLLRQSPTISVTSAYLNPLNLKFQKPSPTPHQSYLLGTAPAPGLDSRLITNGKPKEPGIIIFLQGYA